MIWIWNWWICWGGDGNDPWTRTSWSKVPHHVLTNQKVPSFKAVITDFLNIFPFILLIKVANGFSEGGTVRRVWETGKKKVEKVEVLLK